MKKALKVLFLSFALIGGLAIFDAGSSAYALRVYDSGDCSGSGGNCMDNITVRLVRPCDVYVVTPSGVTKKSC